MNDALRVDPSPDDEARRISVADITSALAHADGHVARAASSLGLPSRFARYRLMKRFGIKRGDDEGDE